MTHDPDPSVPAPGGADPLDDTQLVDMPRFAPTPDPRPDTRWAWADPNPSAVAASRAPAPAEPAPWWATPSAAANTWSSPASAATAAWAAPTAGSATAASAGGGWAAPTQEAVADRRSGPGVGTVAVVALLAAVLASSGTVLALRASGTFNAPVATPVVLPATGGTGTTGGTGGSVNDDASAVISSSAKVSPAVVKITTKSSAATDPFSGTQPDGVGSGIIYDANGWILTNHHVVTGADALTVETKDGNTFRGTVYGIDTLTDLAIVKVDGTGLPIASLGSSGGLKVGQLVVAVGSPLGTYSFSVTSGIVSGKGRSVIVSGGAAISNLIQTDAAINPGNSGGPLADADGNVVGINTAMADGSSGIGFAIPIDIAKPIMAQAVRGEPLARPYIGIRYEMIDPKVKAAQSLSVDDGALVINDSTSSSGSAVASGSPAEAAGLKDGDVITAINGIALDGEHPLNLLLVQFAPKDTVKLTVLRDGQTLTIPLTLGVRPDNLQ